MSPEAPAAGRSTAFVDAAQRAEANHLGMWTFLTTEILFFGGLFACYALYRTAYPAEFKEGSRLLEFGIGTANTALLLTSSLCMALGDEAVRRGDRRWLGRWLALTWVLGALFLVLKGTEYYDMHHEHLMPGVNYLAPAGYRPQVELFVFLYFAMTGLHAAHMLIGLGAIGWLMWLNHRGRLGSGEHAPVSMVGLYWHFVDSIWVFLYPLLYLVGR